MEVSSERDDVLPEMMCCPLTGNDCGEEASCFREVVRTARRTHTCFECREEIKPGQRYEYASGVWGQRPSSYKTCLSCVEIRNHFACEGFLFGQLWSDLEENFFPDMRAGGPCMEGLSPEAKARLFERRMRWIEDE